MADPLKNIDRETFKRIQCKAKMQMANLTTWDHEMMALMIGWLNWRYKNRAVYFGLLNEPGMGMDSVDMPEATKQFFLFHRLNGIWSVAALLKDPARIFLFDGVTTMPVNMANDKARKERLHNLQAAITAEIECAKLVPITDRSIFGHGDECASGMLCVAWAEAMYRG
ncbi:hypothetical protein VTK56DRAFT_3493 [Thermocarpiscus australiensis]